MLRPLFYIPLCHIRYSCRKAVVIFHKNRILPCKKILKIWRSGKLGIDIFPAWEYGNANNFKRPIARSGR